MNDLLFYTLLIAITYYSLVHLPAQKSPSLSPNSLTHSKNTQTEPTLEPTKDTTELKKLQSQLQAQTQELAQKEKTIKELEQQITKLQSEIRDLVKKPLKPTHSKSTQTDELTNTLDNLIKDIQELNNFL